MPSTQESSSKSPHGEPVSGDFRFLSASICTEGFRSSSKAVSNGLQVYEAISNLAQWSLVSVQLITSKCLLQNFERRFRRRVYTISMSRVSDGFVLSIGGAALLNDRLLASPSIDRATVDRWGSSNHLNNRSARSFDGGAIERSSHSAARSIASAYQSITRNI